MSKERLTIPTPAGPRKVCCKCDGLEWSRKNDDTLTPVSCLGCDWAFKNCFASGSTSCGECIYSDFACVKCGESYVVFKNKEDEV